MSAQNVQISIRPNKGREVTNIIYSLTALFFGMALLILGNTLLSIIVPLEMEKANYATSTSGAIMASYFLGFAGGAYYGQHLVLNVGHIRTFAFFATMFSAAVVAHPLIFDPIAWGLFRFTAGMCTAGLFLVIESWLNDRAPVDIRGKVLAVYTTLTYASQFLGLQLVNFFDLGKVEPYLIATLLLSLSLVPVVLTKISAPVYTETKPMSLSKLTRFSPLAVAGVFVSGVMMGCFYSLAVIYARILGYSVSEASNVGSAMVIGGLIFLFPIGWLTDKFDRRWVLVWVLFVSAGACLCISYQNALLPGIVPLLALTLVLGATMSSIYPIAITQAYDYLEPEEYVSAATGLFVAFAAGSFGGPLIAGFLMDFTKPQALFVIMATCSGSLGVFTLYRMSQREALPVDEQETVVVAPTTALVTELDPRTEEEVQEELFPEQIR